MRVLTLAKRGLRACLPQRLLDAVPGNRAARHGRVPALGMITKAERVFFADCARQCRDQDGAVIDLGCWMGATSMALAQGLAGTRGADVVEAYDCFTWAEWMNGILPDVWCDYLPGDCFLPEARRRTRPFGDGLRLRQADLRCHEYAGAPIKLLLVDAMKSWALARGIVGSFYPALQAGSLLIHQDFKHYYTPWIHIVQYRLRTYFDFVASVADGGTAAFRTRHRIPHAVALAAAREDTVTNAEAEQALAYSKRLLREQETVNVAAAHVMYFIHTNQLDEARQALRGYDGQGFGNQGEFAQVRSLLHQAGAADAVPTRAA